MLLKQSSPSKLLTSSAEPINASFSVIRTRSSKVGPEIYPRKKFFLFALLLNIANRMVQKEAA
jgi:hypothetical protein